MNAYGTHQRFLLRAALNTYGPILELGCGWYSTPILHEVGMYQRRFILSQDNDPAWLEQMRTPFECVGHAFTSLKREDWGVNERWGLVFVDHGPKPEEPRNSKGLLNALDRAQAVLDLIHKTDVFVLHDTQPSVRWEYDWDKVLPLFKYRVDDTTHEAHTTILSNRIDVTQWN